MWWWGTDLPVEEAPGEGGEDVVVDTSTARLLSHDGDLAWVTTVK